MTQISRSSFWAKKETQKGLSHQGHSQFKHPLESEGREETEGREERRPHTRQFLHTRRPAGRTEHEWEAIDMLNRKKNRNWVGERKGKEKSELSKVN